MQELKFKIKGITPLLCHNPSAIGKSKPGAKKIPLPEEEAELGLYRDKKGNICFPANNVRSALLDGSKGLKSGRTAVSQIISHAMVFSFNPVDSQLIPIKDSKGKQVGDYEVDARPSVIQKQRILRHRPKINDWSLEFKIVYDEEFIPQARDIFEMILMNGGIKAGLGDYRVSKRGWFGQFVIDK